MSQLDMFPHLPRRLTHEEILAGFAELLRAVEAMEFWEPGHEHPPHKIKIKTVDARLRPARFDPMNKTSSIQIGTKIERIASDYTGGRKGTVIEIKDGRARIVWDAGHPRTWIKFAALLVLAAPVAQTVRGEWFKTPGSKRHSAIRVCTNEASGMTWHEYQKL